jgi:hypothetical protein
MKRKKTSMSFVDDNEFQENNETALDSTGLDTEKYGP